MQRTASVTFSLFVVLCIGAGAQNELRPGSYLRYRGGVAVIETNIPAKIKPGTSISAAVYKTMKKISSRISKSAPVPDCAATLPEAGQICLARLTAEARLIYRIDGLPDDAKKYSVTYAFTDDRGTEIDQIISAATDCSEIKPEIGPFNRDVEYFSDRGRARLTDTPNGMIKLPIVFPNPNVPRNPVSDDYIEERIDRLFDWLELHESDPANVASVLVEPQTQAIPNNDPLTFKIKAFRFTPESRQLAKDLRAIDVYLITDKDLPPEEFALKVTLNDAPIEFADAILATMKGVKNIPPPDASRAGNDKSLELREIKTNFDASVAFTSSVEEKRQGKVNIRTRQNNAVLDLMFAPILNKPLDDNEVHLFTPFFVDAKVSNGPISEKTLSLNRIILGTQYAVRWRPKDRGFNKYVFSFQGLNVSDRDFKRVEAKFNFAFRPIFSKWNKPLENRHVTPEPPSRLVPENGPKFIRTGSFGYQIQPTVGFELGGVYRSRRSAFNNEDSSRDLRRVFFGLDSLFNITRFANLKFTDTFYIRGESSTARYRNYFKGELSVPILLSPRTAQSVFLSFERGNQPPFVTPSVNAIKIGYRISSAFFGPR